MTIKTVPDDRVHRYAIQVFKEGEPSRLVHVTALNAGEAPVEAERYFERSAGLWFGAPIPIATGSLSDSGGLMPTLARSNEGVRP
jgi:hypothetical protein